MSSLLFLPHELLHLFILFRNEDREFAPRLKTAENANIQPNPGLILRAEPTVTNILKVTMFGHRMKCGVEEEIKESVFDRKYITSTMLIPII